MTTASNPSQLYYVPSAQNRTGTGAPHFYGVGEFPGSRQPFRCECLAGQNGRRCWHAEAVIAGMVRPARLKATVTAAPARPAPDLSLYS